MNVNGNHLEGIWEKLSPKTWAAVVAVAAIAAMGRSVFGGFLDFDDPSYVVENSAIKGLTLQNLKTIWLSFKMPQYYPMVFTSYMLEYSLFGLNPAAFHATNVIIHAANSGLAYLTVRKLSGSTIAAVVAGVLFAVHPVHVESVAWITERKDMLSGLFFLLALLIYLKYTDAPSRKLYAWSLGCFVLAMLSKTMAATLPGMLVLIDWQRGRRFGRNVLLEKLPFLVISIGLLAVTWVVEHRGTTPADDVLKNVYTPLSGLASPAFYLQKMVAPLKLSMIYPPIHTEPGLLAGRILITIAVLALSIAAWAKRREWGMLLLGFFVMLLPIAGLVPFRYVMRTSPVADHFLYLPLLGFAAAVGVLVSEAVRRRPDKLAVPALAVTACIAAVLAAMSASRCAAFFSGEALWRDALKKNSSVTAAVPLNNLGTLEGQRGELQNAELFFKEALRLNPGYTEAMNNLGLVEMKKGNLRQAEQHIGRALKLHPNYSVYLVGMADVRLRQSRQDDAEKLLRKALNSKPDSYFALTRLARLLMSSDRKEEGLRLYELLVYYHSSRADAFAEYSRALAAVGDTARSEEALDRALQLDPDNADALADRGLKDLTEGDLESAERRLARAYELSPDSAETLTRLASLRGAQGKPDEAETLLRKAGSIRRDDPEILLRLGLALRSQAKTAEAMQTYERALSLKPSKQISSELNNSLAWILATSADARFRDGARAVTLARQALKDAGADRPALLDTLAAAQARAGDYASSAATQSRCIALLEQAGQSATEESRRLQLYRSGRPYTGPI